MTSAVEQAKEEGVQVGRRQSQAEFFGSAAALMPLMLFADAAHSIAQRLQAYSPQVAAFFAEQAAMYARLATAPRVVSSTPVDGSGGITVASPMSVTFENPIPEGQMTSDFFYVMNDAGGPHLNTELQWDPDTNSVLIIPANDLSEDTTYRITVKAGISNAAGIQSAEDWTARFTTVAS